MSLTKEQLLKAERKRVTVDLPQFPGAFVILQAPTAGEWLEYQKWLGSLPPDALDHLVRIVAITAIDEEGKPLLTDEDCRGLPHDVLTTLSRAAFALTRTSEPGLEAVKGES